MFTQAGAGVELSPGSTKKANAGDVVTYTHTLTNTGDAPDTFVVQATSSQGWPVALIGGAYPIGTLYLPLSLEAGMTATFQVRLTVPAGSTMLVGVVDRIVITVTSQVSPILWVTATDTTLVPPSGGYTVFLPLIASATAPPTKLGVDFGYMMFYTDVLTHDLPLARQMGADWIRVQLPWFDIEKIPGQYDWAPYDTLFARTREVGFKPLPLIYGAPSWATAQSCGPISDMMAFENFLQVVLTRYGPLVDAWEFTNEPDGREPHPWGPIIGCWAPYPAEYASQLGIFYHQVKKFDPGALVLLGGLAYDDWAVYERSFFSKTLQSGAGQFFDVANLHYYPINPQEFPTMAHKVKEIQEAMFKNRVYGKQIWVTETAMWVNRWGSQEIQRNFIVQELSRGFCSGADNIFWYGVREEIDLSSPTSPAPLFRWLINRFHQPDNGYFTFQHYASKIKATRCAGPYQGVPPNVEAYEFFAPGRSLYVLWSNTTPTTVVIPASTDAILTDRDGGSPHTITAQGGQVSFQIGPQPVFLEFAE